MVTDDAASARRDTAVLLAARLCMASLFIFSGLEKTFYYAGAVGFAQSFGVPFARYLLAVAIAIELVGAAALISPRYCRIGAAVLAAWVLGLNLWFHHFWLVPADHWQEAVDGFFHHWVMFGGLVTVAVVGAKGRA